MTGLSPGQERLRERIEGLIRLASPALDVMLAAGERVSRLVEPHDHTYQPVERAGEPALLEAPRASGEGSGDGGAE